MTSKRIIRTYLVLAGLYTLATSIIWGVNTLFLLEAGLTIFQVFLANAVFTASMAVFEIPTGVLADTLGRRVSFLLSLATLCVGTLGYVGAAYLGGGILLFGLMSAILGLGYTFYSGAMEAWLVDALKDTGYGGKLDSVFARGSIVSGVSMLVGTVGGGFLGTVNLGLPFIGRAALLALVFAMAYFSMFDMGFSPRVIKISEYPSEIRRVAIASINFGWNRTSIRLLMIGSFIQGLFYAWGFYAWQPYFLELLGQDLPWVSGLIAALVALATIGGNYLVEWFTRFCGRRTTLLLWAVAVQSVAAVGVGLANSFWMAVAFYLLVMGATGVWMPVRQAYLHQVAPSEQRATVVSFDSLFTSLGSAFGQTGLGRVAQLRSIATGYIIGGLVSLLAVPVMLSIRKLDEPADHFVGLAGAHSACAAQGLPNVTGVDTTKSVLPVTD